MWFIDVSVFINSICRSKRTHSDLLECPRPILRPCLSHICPLYVKDWDCAGGGSSVWRQECRSVHWLMSSFVYSVSVCQCLNTFHSLKSNPLPATRTPCSNRRGERSDKTEPGASCTSYHTRQSGFIVTCGRGRTGTDWDNKSGRGISLLSRLITQS